ncbi:GAF domain-containing protein [Myxacorys almedinensis]|uniref:histidine kinase n=1 Tax=Myxacorys almedinensis A TaxID=2690445 RepID=A0A8J7Z6Z0_9CYAN|nr:GAF domain-containing protein [Myxacorys almedinensis]NDJ19193.1 GAF domain-containing protein [Myxacorys almedinensis A]
MTNSEQIESVTSQVANSALHLETGVPFRRTSQQIKAEIEAAFGFVPPFFEPAESTPQVLENMWQQTLTAYVKNPLPALFKEKLSAYLSRFCAVPYCMICHSCTLRPLGLSAQQVLELLETAPPIETDVDQHLARLAAQPALLLDGSALPSELEQSLLACAIFIALEHEQAEPYRLELRRILGVVNYQYLIVFIAYVKTCHVWMEAYPEVAYEADQRVQKNLSFLLADEPALADFFRNYRERAKRESQSRAEQLAEFAERQRQEEVLRQQVAQERLVMEISQRIRRSLNLDEILSTAVAEVRQLLDVDRVFIYRFEPDWSGIIAVESVIAECLSIEGTRITDSFFVQPATRELYKQGRIQAISDIDSENLSNCHRDLLARLQVRANVVVPIVQGEQLWGLLVANHCLAARQWQALELTLLQHLATQLAIAIQQSGLYQQVQAELSERRRSEEKIREQAVLLDVTTDAILVLNLDNQILFWNKGANQLYGWSTAEALTMSARDLLGQNPPLQLEEIQKMVVETGKWQGELPQLTKNGKEVLVESRWTSVMAEGQLTSILVVNTDITQKKQLERQFLHAQRLESLGTLAGGIAHDLNNILTPILAIAQLLQLKLGDMDESTQRFLKMQETNARRGAALVNQVLSFARGAEGKRVKLQVQHLLLELKQIIDGTFPKAIALRMDLEPHLWVTSADATQLHQVLMNLCVNARDAMLEGGTLSISAKNLLIDHTYAQMNLAAEAGSYIVISVADTGTGIAPEVIDRIFEPFFTTKEAGKGTGLGLSTVIGIVRNHGGFVNAYSEPGQGTEFKVYLPAVQGAEMQQIDQSEPLLGNGELVLVVDDEVTIREITKASLETYRYTVLVANDGIEAIALYAQHKDRVSAVLMDMMMPNMAGLTAIGILRRINPLVKIIAVSGLSSTEKVTAAMEAGVSAFLSKPYTAQELLKTLDSVLVKTKVPQHASEV